MNLLSPIMLAGVLFGAIPLIIHLLNRSRYKIEPFGAMMFLKAASRERAQNLKLRQLLLLLMRMLLFTLLALALARPVSNRGTTAANVQPTTHVVIIDGSYSMQQTSKRGTLFDEAKGIASSILDDMASHDNMLIIWAGNKARPLSPAPTYDKAQLRRTLQNLKPGIESSNIPEALQQALWTLEASNLPQHRVYLLTDQQGHGWHAEQEHLWTRLEQHRDVLKIRPQIYVTSLEPSANLVNVAPVAIRSRFPIVDVYRKATFEVELENFGEKERTVRLEFGVDGAPLSHAQVQVPPGRTTRRFDHQFLTHGDHHLRVEIKDDDLAVDNVLTEVVSVLNTMPILLIDGHPDPDLFASSGGLLQMALEASAEPGQESLFSVRTASHLETDSFDASMLQQYRCVILSNLPSVSQRFAFLLEQYAEGGGGVLVALGDRVVPAAYGPLVKEGTGILPAKIDELVDVPTEAASPSFTAGAGALVLANFDLTRTRVIQAAKILKHWACTPHESSQQLAELNEKPLLLYRGYGRGRVGLWTTSMNVSWTNFPVTPDFLPLIQDLIAYLAATPAPSQNLNQGAQLVSPTTSSEPTTLTTPDGAKHELSFDTEGNNQVVRWSQTIDPGIYTVMQSGTPDKLFGVATPKIEAQLAPIGKLTKELASRSVSASFVANKEELNARIAEESGVQEWWRHLIVAAIALSCLELAVGRVFSA